MNQPKGMEAEVFRPMNRPRSDKPGGGDSSMEDPAFIAAALQALFEAEVEFPIKVEGTSTLPYASVVKEVRASDSAIVLKLVRPLPHELLPGAVFEMVFPVDEQRFEARVCFQGREAYLQYRFDLPSVLTHADRRRAKRYPFRPRESAYVIAQDGRIPGMGVAGPLVNISMGGLALRVDRVLKLDDGMRVPPSAALFERGKGFPQLRIQDLPRLPLFEWRGVVAHASTHGSEVILGLEFGELGEEEARQLGDSLAFREKVFRGAPSGVLRPEGGGNGTESGDEPDSGEGEDLDSGVEAAFAPLPSGPGGDPLRRMRRRSARVLLVMPDGEARSLVLERLALTGFQRVEVIPNLPGLKASLASKGGLAPVALLLVDLALAGAGDVEPLAAVRILEQGLAVHGTLPLAILCEGVDPTLFLALGPRSRILPYRPLTPPDERGWVACLDGLLGL